jgi:hypothetical protein
MIRKFQITKIAFLSILLSISFVISSQISAQTTFDKNKDGLVTDYRHYQTFGGKTSKAASSVSYTVFLPDGFGFNPNTDDVQLLYSGGKSAGHYVAYDTRYKDVCSKVTGGYNCIVTWTFDENQLSKGEYIIYFKVLDSNTMRKGQVYMDVFGYNPAPGSLYTTEGHVFFDKPITTPYAEFIDLSSLYNLIDKQEDDSLELSVKLNTQNAPTSVDYYLDSVLVGSAKNPTIVTDYSMSGGQASIFSYKLSNLSSLSVGSHTVNAIARGVGYNSDVFTTDGQTSIILIASFSANNDCSKKIKAIDTITLSAINQKTSQLNQIEVIDNKVRAYFADNPDQYSGYSDYIVAADNANQAVYKNLAEMVRSNIFGCDNFSDQVDIFITNFDTVQASLEMYRDTVINLIEKVGNV